ncbi:MAG: 30S ribosomal protein S13, partial [Anaerolineales bacterium]|nr:30S ribosomal protein S13 [Anaerolineales bacterium]
MARISGIDIPRNKRIEVSLTYIYGIGRQTAKEILTKANVDPDTRTRDLSEAEVTTLRQVI